MQHPTQRKMSTKTMVLGAVMTALVIIMQLLGTYTTFFGPFSTALALVPSVIGAALCGAGVGAWLGLIFGLVVLVTGGAALFLAFNVPGTLITVLVKGMACGLAAGLSFRLARTYNKTVAVILAALLCPVTNTAVFLLGSALFFLPYADAIAQTIGLNVSGMALFWALAMGNFLFEVAFCLLLAPAIVRLLQIKSKLS